MTERDTSIYHQKTQRKDKTRVGNSESIFSRFFKKINIKGEED